MRAWMLVAVLFAAACGDGSGTGTGAGSSTGSGTGTGTSTGTGTGTGTSTGSGTGSGATPTCTNGTTEPCNGNTNGSCDPGIRTCVDGQFTACEGRVQPVAGLCNTPSCAGGLNTGCDCLVGQTRECDTYGAPVGVLRFGPCRRGFQQCEVSATGSRWGACTGEVLPGVEDCTGRDLDCDPSNDNACTCTNGQTRPCGGVTGGSCQLGTQTCSGGKWGACNGAVQPVGGDCSTPSCLGGPNPGCLCVIGTSTDCYTGPAGTENVGSCKAGKRECGPDGTWSPVCTDARPRPQCDIPNCTGTPLAECL